MRYEAGRDESATPATTGPRCDSDPCVCGSSSLLLGLLRRCANVIVLAPGVEHRPQIGLEELVLTRSRRTQVGDLEFAHALADQPATGHVEQFCSLVRVKDPTSFTSSHREPPFGSRVAPTTEGSSADRRVRNDHGPTAPSDSRGGSCRQHPRSITEGRESRGPPRLAPASRYRAGSAGRSVPAPVADAKRRRTPDGQCLQARRNDA